jgi:hypothetical protein
MVSPGLSHIAKNTFHKIALERNFRTILQPSNTKFKKMSLFYLLFAFYKVKIKIYKH